MKKLIGIIMALALAFAGVSWAAEALPKDLAGYKHAGSLVIPDKNSPLFGIHHFYMNKKAQGALEKGTTYPDGAIFVGRVFEVVTTPEGAMNEGKMLFQTYMRKDAKKAKDTGGWVFAAFAPDGNKVEKDAKKDCFECHTAAKASDFVFSKPLR